VSLERSDRIYEVWQQASEKYDYFVAGASLALVSYLAANLHPSKCAWNPGTLETAATMVILGSTVSAFKRIETNIVFLRVMHARLHGEEMSGALTQVAIGGVGVLNVSTGEPIDPATAAQRATEAAAQAAGAEELLYKLQRTVGRWFWLRDRLLLCGLVLLIAARIWSAYVPAAAVQ